MTSKSHWRELARQAIHEALARHESELADALKAGQWDDDGIVTPEYKYIELAIRDAYPFGMREYHPYQMWLKEQRAALDHIANGIDPRNVAGHGMSKDDVRNYWTR